MTSPAATEESVIKYVTEVRTDMDAKSQKAMDELKVELKEQAKKELEALKILLETQSHQEIETMRLSISETFRKLMDEKDTKKERKREDITSKRGFDKLPKYGGKHSEYDDWKFKMMTFLSGTEYLNEILLKLNEFTKQPTVKRDPITGEQGDIDKIFSDLEDAHGYEKVDREWLNSQLFMVLSMNVVDSALSTIRNMQEDTDANGVLGWWKLGKEVSAMTPVRLQGLANKVYAPKRVKKYSEISAAIDNWEMDLRLFEKAEGNSISEQTKIYSIRQLVPEDLEKDIVKSNTLTTYDEVRAYISEQTPVRKEHKNANTGPVAMDLDVLKKVFAMVTENPEESKDDYDYNSCGGGKCNHEPEQEEDESEVGQLMTFFKGMMGKGGKGEKGKGKGDEKFDGNCDWCHAYGHRARDCRKKDRYMENIRKGGKDSGKGDKGGYGGGFKGYGKGSKGYGKGDKGYGKGNYGKGAYLNTWDTTGGASSSGGGGNGWSFSLTKSTSPASPAVPGPPGLGGRNRWEALDQIHEEQEDEIDEDAHEEKRIAGVMAAVSGVYANYLKDFPKTKMGNYSKASVKNMGERVDMRKKGRPLNFFTKEAPKTPATKELHPAVEYKTVQDGWVKVKGVMDSGASEAVAPPTMCPHYEIRPSAGSIAGQNYVSASDDLIPNLGEQDLEAETEDGRPCHVKYQMAEVSRPLNSVSEICDAGGEYGQHVIFGRNGGAIINLETGRQTPFKREDGIYVLEIWVKPKDPGDRNASGFHRRG